MQNPDDVVPMFPVHRHTGLSILLEGLQNLRSGRVHRHEGNVCSGRHDVFDRFASKVEDVIDELGLNMVERSFADRFVSEGTNHVLGHDIAG